jgi:alkylresorcinol/alkylpyrone synthase
MNIAAVGRAFPRHYYDQEQLIHALRSAWSERHFNLERIEQLHRSVLVGGRYLALPIEAYASLTSFGAANDAWIQVGLEIGEAAVRDALGLAELSPKRVGAFFFTSVTGIAAPSLDARLLNRLALPSSVKRVPIFGLGCLGGAAGIARAADYVKAFPDEAALLLSVELCSLTLQREDLSIPNLIASGLFGDGAACAVILGAALATELDRNRGPSVLATRSVFYPNTENVMGWRISERGFSIVLSPEVPDIAQKVLPNDVDSFLASQGLKRSDIESWVCHPGGPKVLEGLQQGLGLSEQALALSWETLRRVGNISSTSVLLVLRDTMDQARPRAGAPGLLLAMGPGFCSELVLLGW